MYIRYRDLSVSDPVMKRELLDAVDRVLSHGRIILGPEVEEFEKQIAAYCNRKYAVGMGCGTDALFLSLQALGIGPGDEVITTPLSWIATLNAVVNCGATPVFADIGEDLNIDPDRIAEAVTSKTKAILPVHFTGRLCKMKSIMEIAEKNNLLVIEDAAQSFGAHIDGKQAGSFGNVGCFSMNAMKVLCSYGEAGAALTDDEQLYDRLISYRYHGTVNKEDCHFPGINGRIDTIQAAMMLVNFRYLDKRIKRLREIAAFYDENLKDIVFCPPQDESFHTYYSYNIVVENRDRFQKYLMDHGIETKIQHPILMPYHTAYRNRFPRFDLPVAERMVDRIICIPNHEKLTDEEVEYVVKTIRAYHEEFGKV